MKILLIVFAVLAGLLVLAGLTLYLIGRAQPERHTAMIHFTLKKSRTIVWAALTDYAAMPAWWPAVTAVRTETRPNGDAITWNKDKHGREMGFRTKAEAPPARLVREIVGEGLPFGGTWTFELMEENGGTRVTLTEDGFVTSPLFRGVAALFMKPDATMRDFEKHFVPFATAK